MTKIKHDGKWARAIIALQKEDGTWGGQFHTLSAPLAIKPLTTEQALRRLGELGFTANDEPVRKALDYMKVCLGGERKMDNSWEKTHDWGLFTKMMLSAWIRIFEPKNAVALEFARRWARVVEAAFSGGGYDNESYTTAYADEFGKRPNGPRELDFVSFYQVSLLRGVLTRKTENLTLGYILSKPDGIYYINCGRLDTPPETFASKKTSRWLAGLEILAGYETAREKLRFAADRLSASADSDGKWDLGPDANDGIYFPLSDSWRNAEDRRADCTERITSLLGALTCKNFFTRD